MIHYLYAAVQNISAAPNSPPQLVPIVRPNKEPWAFNELVDAKIHSILFKQKLGDMAIEIHGHYPHELMSDDDSHYEVSNE